MRLIKFIFPLILIFLSSCSVNQQIKKADKKYGIGEYHKASGIYKSAFSRVKATKEPQKKAYVAFQMGECYMLINESTKAEKAFSDAIRYKHKDDIVYLLYADVLRKNRRMKAAEQNYTIYLRKHPDDLRAINGRNSALEALEWEKNPTRYKVKKVTSLSSKKSERCPAHPGGDPDIVYFSSSRENKAIGGKNSNITGIRNNDIFVARRNSVGQWDNIEPVEGEEINTIDDEGSPSFSEDGKIMFFTRARFEKGESLGAEIYSSVRSGGKWGKAEKIKLSEDSTITFAHPTLSPDGEYLYFVSDLPGGHGGKDIWRSKRSGGSYGAPVNLGPTINTSGDEMYPYMRSDSTLYFSSNGHPGFGGLDIFRAKEREDGTWEVHNMMYPINSNMDDFGITFEKEKERGLFSSNRGERTGYTNIWEFELPIMEFAIEGKVISSGGEPLAEATVRIVGTDGTNVKIQAKKDGTFKFPLQKGVDYVLLGNSRGFLNQKNALTTVGLEDTKTFPVTFNLASISKPVGLDNIFFEFGKATLTPESSTALNKLVDLLNDNPNITIEIGAHTDKVGSAEGNLLLSGRRAESVVDYLIKGGIDAERLTAKGYGKSQPVVADKNLAKQHPFLKEEDTLDEEFIDKLPPEQQEVANQINRRTEFRVLKTTYKMY